jgi:acyl carrier protein
MMDELRPAPDSAAVIEAIVLEGLRTANLARDPASQLAVATDAPIFGSGSPLDSLGLVALLLDIEEALQDRGYAVVLSDERAVSQRRSPFRSVPALVESIASVLQVA